MNNLLTKADPIAGPRVRPDDGAAAFGLESAPWVSAECRCQ
ncbi:hypothetical protein [Roseovarius sp. MMSF_3281]|nr:hypothetical protein [Roseovarius sp. MMSF_3281]